MADPGNSAKERAVKKTAACVIPAAILILLLFVPATWSTEGRQSGEAERIRTSIAVLQEIARIPEQSIPPALLRQAEAIAIIPGVYKVGFVVGGRYGKGVLAIRDQQGDWGNPFFITLTGGSVGWQIGAQATDLILVFKDRGRAEAIKEGRFTLGADAAVAAGPMGRQAAAATDIRLESEIYSYSRSRGLFAGISLEGAVLEPDRQAISDYYGKPIGEVETVKNVPAGAREFKQTLTEYAR
jgi:lipid-binding SYLF domain-containing protein